jgi:hypothetical protein
VGRRLVPLLAVVAVLANAPGAGAERQFTIVLGNQPAGVIAVPNSKQTQAVQIAFLPAAAPLPQKVVIQVPTGYKLDLGARPGTRIANAQLFVTGVGSSSPTTADTEVIAQDPARYAGDPIANACAPGTHAAVWSISMSFPSRQVDMTIFVDRSTAAGVAYTLQSCPTGLPGGNGRSMTRLLIYGFDVLVSPAAPGRYLWHVFVTPAGAPTYELQALLPLPESVRVDARYDVKRKIATLTGRVLEAAKPVAGARVDFETARGTFHARTKANGRVTIHVRITRTTEFHVTVAPGVRPCTGSSTAPGGCINAMTVPPEDAHASVWVSVRGGAVRAIRAKDQARAERANISAADLPVAFAAIRREASTCMNPRHEADLTITGESTMEFLTNGPGEKLTQVLGLVRVFATAEQARAAFAREAVVATARCELKGMGGPSRRKITRARLPGLAARSLVFRGGVDVGFTTVANADFVFLQRGRTTALVRFVIAGASRQIVRTVAAKVASRMR